MSVIYQSHFSHKFNNRNLTVIISFSLFKHSWSASFSHLLGRPVLNSRWCAVCSSWLPSTPPPPSPGTACVSLPAGASVCAGALTTFSCHSMLSASPSQKAGKLGTLSSHEPRCPAVIQFPSQPPCCSRIHSEPQIKEWISRLYLVLMVWCCSHISEKQSRCQGRRVNLKSFSRFTWVG